MNLKRGSENKKAQVTIFIIVAILVIAIAVLIYFLLTNKSNLESSSASSEINPTEYISTCLEDSVGERIEAVLLGGGSIEGDLVLNLKIEDEDHKNITCLCYTEEEAFCEIQEPSIIKHMENELNNYLSSETEYCFNHLLENLEEKGYNQTENYENFEADLIEGELVVSFDASLSYSKGESSFIVDKMVFEYSTELYGIGKVVQEIVEDESEKGYFDRFDYMTNHPDYYINRYKVPNSIKIYTVKNENSNEEFRFAIKGGL